MPRIKSILRLRDYASDKYEVAMQLTRKNLPGDFSQIYPFKMFDKVDEEINLLEVLEELTEKDFLPYAKKKLHWEDLWTV